MSEVLPRLRSRQRKRKVTILLALYGDRCFYCRRTFRPTGSRQRTLDHRYPLCRGGTHKIENLVLSCYKCNNTKGDMTWIEYVQTETYRERLRYTFAEERRAERPSRPVIEVVSTLKVAA